MEISLTSGSRVGINMEQDNNQCICKGSIIKGYAQSRLSYYYLLLMSGRNEELHNALLKDMTPCPVHNKTTGVQSIGSN